MCRKGNVEQAIRMPLSRLAIRQGLRREIVASVVVIRRANFPSPHAGRAKIDRFTPISPSALVRPQSRGFERSALALRHAVDCEFLYRFAEEMMKIEPCREVQKHPAETDRSPVHEHKFARHPHRPLFLQGAMNPEGLAPAVLGGLDTVRYGPLAVVKQRPIDEPRPNIEDVNELA